MNKRELPDGIAEMLENHGGIAEMVEDQAAVIYGLQQRIAEEITGSGNASEVKDLSLALGVAVDKLVTLRAHDLAQPSRTCTWSSTCTCDAATEVDDYGHCLTCRRAVNR